LPDPNTNSYLYIANSLSDPGPYNGSILGITATSDFEFDRVGRLFTLTSLAGLNINLSIDGTPISLIPLTGISGDALAMDRTRNRLYVYTNDYGPLNVVDLSAESILATSIDLGSTGYWYEQGGVAVDSSGFIYVPGGTEAAVGATNGIMKLDVTNPNSPIVLTLMGYEQLGLGYDDLGSFTKLTIEDMTVVDGKLYIALGKHVPYDHRGKIVEIDLSTFSMTREIGWSNTAIVSTPEIQFYGPKRFIAIKPRRLIIADEGYANGDKNRVVEVDLDTWAFSGTGLNDVVGFFESYSC